MYKSTKKLNCSMVRFFLVFIILCFSTSILFGQCTKAFQLSFGGTGDDIAYDVADAGNGQFFAAGTTNSFGAGGLDVLITKMSAGGSIVWSKVYGGTGTETVRKIAATPDSGLLVIGLTTSFNSNGDIFCMKVDAKGNLVWSRRFGISTDVNGDLGLNIIQTTDGGYALTGVFGVAGQIGRLVFAKLDASANIVWFKRLYGSQGSDGTGIIQDGDNLIVTTDLDHNGVNYTSLIMRCNMTNGSIINQTEIVPSSRGLFGPFLFKDINSNGYWLSCHTIDQYSYAAMQPTILHLDNNFKILNTFSYKVPGVYTNDYFTGFSQMSDGFIACASSTTSPTSGYLFYVQNDGTVKWSKNFVGKSDRSLYRLQHIGSQIISVGRDDSNGKGDDFFVSGFGDNGFIDSLCHPDTSAVAITNPVFSENSFTWTTIDNPTFADISAPISVSTVSLTPQSLCDACPVPVVTPAFTIPDTVCVNSSVAIKNTTVGASTYYWSFCTADINQPPTGVNLGNPSGLFNTPVYIDYVYANGNYYGFSTNNYPGKLLRLDFGSSLLNTPTVTDLGTVNGVIPNNTEGVQIEQNSDGNWYVIVVGGDATDGVTPSLITIKLGTNIANNSPTGTNWGNLGSLAYPHDLYVFQDNGHWYGITVNTSNNTVTRFDFTTSFANTPTGVNLGNVGNLNGPTGLHALKDNSGNWHVFITNALSSTLTRLDFGSSLLNTPTGVNLGNINNTFNTCWDIYLIKYCGNTLAYVINAGDNTLVKLDFNGDLTNTPTGVNFGNIGNLNFPHCLSKLFRVGADVFTFITSVNNNTLTRLQFSGCTNASVPNSTVQNPPSVTYSTPGVYNINLTIDDGLATQNSLCQQVVVLGPPTIKISNDTSICSGDSVQLSASGGATYQWSSTPTLSNPNISNPVAKPLDSTMYYVTVENSTGCAAKDSVSVAILLRPIIKTIPDTAICNGATIQLVTSVVNGVSYTWSPSAGLSSATILSPYASPTTTIIYTIDATGKNGCTNKDSIKVTVTNQATIKTIADTSICSGTAIVLSTTAVNGNTYSWLPTTALSNPSILSPTASPTSNTQYIVTVNPGSQCSAKATVNITVNQSPLLSVSADTAICAGGSVQLAAIASGSPAFSWSPSATLSNAAIYNPVASPTATTTYYVQAIGNNNCKSNDSVVITVTPMPAITTLSDTTIVLCRNSTIQLTTVVTNASVYSWSPSTGLSDANALSPYATPLVDTKYIITAKNGQCVSTDSVNITVKPSPSVTAAGDTTICAGSTVQLSSNASPDVTYSWLPVTGVNDPSSPNPLATPTSTTVYVVQVAYSNGCTAKDSVNIKVDPQPTVKSIPDTAICYGTTIQLVTTASNGSSYGWSPSTGLSNAAILSPSASPSSTTQYIITVDPGSQCIATDTVTVTVNPLPSVVVSADTIICTGGAGQLVASSPDNVTYSWSPITGLSSASIPNPVATPPSTTNYNVTVTDGNFCQANASVSVTVNPQPVFGITPSTASICIGDTVTVTASGGDIYSWNPTSGVTDPTAPSTVLSPQATTNYQVAITNSTCKVTDTVQALITVTTKPVVTISKSNDLDCFVGQATLEATGGDSYTWSPAGSLNNPYSASPVASPFETTTYYVQVSKGAGCVATDSIQLKVLTNEQNGYNVPTVFTPNGDGHNDCFGVKLWGGIKSIDFSVYNRWGQRMFHTNNPNNCWDGTFNGQPQPPGTFVYQIQANTTCGTVYRKGTVVLVR